MQEHHNSLIKGCSRQTENPLQWILVHTMLAIVHRHNQWILKTPLRQLATVQSFSLKMLLCNNL